LPGRNYLAVMPDGGRLYLASSGRITGLPRSLRVRRLGSTYPSTAAYASSDNPVQRGEFFLTPDAAHLITSKGKIYRLAPPEFERPATKFHRSIGEL
jgi:hypothetical protein